MTRCLNHPLCNKAQSGVNYCQECGRRTYGQIVLCNRCSQYLDQCEICCAPAGTGIAPALVQAYRSPALSKMRAARKTAATLRVDIEAFVGQVNYTALLTSAKERLKGQVEPSAAYPSYVEPISRATAAFATTIEQRLCQIMLKTDEAIAAAMLETTK